MLTILLAASEFFWLSCPRQISVHVFLDKFEFSWHATLKLPSDADLIHDFLCKGAEPVLQVKQVRFYLPIVHWAA